MVFDFVDPTTLVDALYSYAVVLTRSHSRSENLVLDAYRVVDSRRDGETARVDKVRMFVALRNVWLDHETKHNHILPGDMSIDIYWHNSLEAAKCLSEDCTEIICVRAAIMRLPLALREVIVLREYEGMSYQEIAVIVGCTIEIVRSHLYAARYKLRGRILSRSCSLENTG